MGWANRTLPVCASMRPTFRYFPLHADVRNSDDGIPPPLKVVAPKIWPYLDGSKTSKAACTAAKLCPQLKPTNESCTDCENIFTDIAKQVPSNFTFRELTQDMYVTTLSPPSTFPIQQYWGGGAPHQCPLSIGQ